MYRLLLPTDLIPWPVTIDVPVAGGQTQAQRFTGLFQVMDDDAMKGLTADQAAKKALKGWNEDLADESGKPLPYSEEVKGKLFGISYARAGVVRAFLNMQAGVAEKNS